MLAFMITVLWTMEKCSPICFKENSEKNENMFCNGYFYITKRKMD